MSWRRLLFAAYICSGAAGLIYEVSWARLLTLSMGHTTAAASTVVAAFMGGLAVGAALGGRVATRLTPRSALFGYAILELSVAGIALALVGELALLTPLLRFAYADGHAPLLFPVIRLTASLLLLTVPAVALGATYPMALRWSAHVSPGAAHEAGALYAANTIGAALGALAAGFLLLPALGLFRTTAVGVSASVLAAILVLLVARHGTDAVAEPAIAAVSRTEPPNEPNSARRGGRGPGQSSSGASARAAAGRRGRGLAAGRAMVATTEGKRAATVPAVWHSPGLAASVLALTGFATFTYEIAWTRVFSMIIGPSTYAFSATLAAVLIGTALGSVAGAKLASRLTRPAVALVVALGLAAVTLAWSTSLVGSSVPRLVMRQLVESDLPLASILLRNGLLIGALILPVAVCLGAAFTLALALVGGQGAAIASRVGLVYAANTVGSVIGSLAAAFVIIPIFGLEHTLWIAVAAIALAAGIGLAAGRLSLPVQIAGVVVPAVALAMIWWHGGWNRALLASGAYKYARNLPVKDDPETALTAGTLVYYRDGAVATVSVKRLTGDLSLSVDGKVDASTSGDMLTQRLLAHLPLLLHPDPHDVAIVGLGSGVTLGAALRHPIRSAEVIELSREVVEASQFFSIQNHAALSDPRTRLIVGDGRSHLLLGTQKYDVLISEPSNPWMAGVAALFTREFFTAMRGRLAPGGLVCQWAHTYDISSADLRSIVGTFVSVFPQATLWQVGEGDLLMVAGDRPLDEQIAGMVHNWDRPGVRADLNEIGARGPFALLSMFLMGPEQMRAFAAGAMVQTDDRLALEFSAPSGLFIADTSGNLAALRSLRSSTQSPRAISAALAGATAADWSGRGGMLARVAANDEAFDNYKTALTIDPSDPDAPPGLVSVAIASHRESEAVTLLKRLAVSAPAGVQVRIALSRLLATSGDVEQATTEAIEACRATPSSLAAWEQLASIFSDIGDAGRLDAAVTSMQQLDPRAAGTLYYAAASHFLHGRLDQAITVGQQALAADPRRATALNLLGATYASLGNTTAARDAFTRSIALNPRDSATYANLALLELNAGDPTTATRWFAEALSLDPASTSARDGLARARSAAR